VLWPQLNGHGAVLMNSHYIFLVGQGASPDGERPFLDRLDINTMELKRIFQSEPQTYEEIVAMLSAGGRVLLTRRETQKDPPNYLLRESVSFKGAFADPGSLTQVSEFKSRFRGPSLPRP
jgi:dipeptidyl aminopeptidase/acylaminoacyl peptidase